MQVQPLTVDSSSAYSCLSYLNPCTLFERVTTNWRQSAALVSLVLSVVGLVSSIFTGTLLAIIAFAVTGFVSGILASELEVLGNLKQTAKDFYDRLNNLNVNIKLQDLQLETFEEQNQILGEQNQTYSVQNEEHERQNVAQEKTIRALELQISTFQVTMGQVNLAVNGAVTAARTLGGQTLAELNAASANLKAEQAKLEAITNGLGEEQKQQLETLRELVRMLSPLQAQEQIKMATALQERVTNLKVEAAKLETQNKANEENILRTNELVKKLNDSVDEEIKVREAMLKQNTEEQEKNRKRLSEEREQRQKIMNELQSCSKELQDGSKELRRATSILNSPYAPPRVTSSRNTSRLDEEGTSAQAGAPIVLEEGKSVRKKLVYEESR